ncbi:unnamed protein product [marine sediment metagenome]|uniref:Uncharacterized protein n=1 Tax=marine sediment metagenome TaxID=412755 RepID=X1ICZ1_9ZZZZ
MGIDPGSKSWDFFGLEDNTIILDTSIPTNEIIKEPQKAITVIKSVEEDTKNGQIKMGTS